MTLEFPPKDPGETITLSFDFTNRLHAGETITAATFSVKLLPDETDVTDMLDGTADISQAPIVMQNIQGGTSGKKYLIQATVTTSDGRLPIGSGILPVLLGA